MTTSPMTDTWQAGGMPSSARVRGAALRGLPVTTGVYLVRWAHPCVLSQDISADRSAMTGSAVSGAFPGTSAWSPPI